MPGDARMMSCTLSIWVSHGGSAKASTPESFAESVTDGSDGDRDRKSSTVVRWPECCAIHQARVKSVLSCSLREPPPPSSARAAAPTQIGCREVGPVEALGAVVTILER